MVSVDCQLDQIQNHQGAKALGMSVKDCLDWVNEKRDTIPLKLENRGGGEMAQQLRMLTVLAKELSSVLKTHVR